VITKSDFLEFLDSPIHLWADKHNVIKNKAPSEYDHHMMMQGQTVEKEAKKFIESVILPTFPMGKLLWQQTFVWKNFQARADAIIHDLGDDSFHLFEIKSSTKEKMEQIEDVAFQTIVIEEHLMIKNVNLVMLNKDYIRDDSLEIEKLFVSSDVTEKVNAIKGKIKELMADAQKAVEAKSPDKLENCLKPETCPCSDLCHPNLPEFSIFDIPNLSAKKTRELQKMGIVAMEKIPDDFPLSPRQKQIVEVIKAKTPHLDKSSVTSLLNSFEFPLYFLDYESFDPAIPMHRGHKPYQHIPFQFSLHIVLQNGEISHEEFLFLEKGDPSKKLVEHLQKHIGEKGTVLVWNKAFEIGRNEDLAKMFPEHSDFLLNVNQRIFDLGEIVSKNHFIHHDFKGSWSIKKVLPVMAPELTYENLPIHKGDQAMMQWQKIVFETMDEENKNRVTKELLEYCKLDTFAMVRIWEEMRKLAKP